MSIQTSQKSHQSQTSYELRPDVAELCPAQTQLVFMNSVNKERAPLRSLAQGSHMVKSIPVGGWINWDLS